jgi:hypothetical protein
MFTHRKWEDICKKISSHRDAITINKILDQSDGDSWISVKHDVETNVKKALQIAKIEAAYNIKATYYVQADLIDDNYPLLQKIAALGHEVTYHYDVLDSSGGDFEKAIEVFNKNIKKFKRYGFEIQTVCPHGNPVMIRKGWSSNKDFFRNKKVVNMFPDILDVVVQLPDLIKEKYIYISDAGYNWKEIVNIQDNDLINNGDIIIKDQSHLLGIIKKNMNLIISTHPHRWESNRIKCYINIVRFKSLKIVVLILSRLPMLKKIISKYYYLAKKI